MVPVCLRAVRYDDLEQLHQDSPQDDPFQFFGFRASNGLQRRYAQDGPISDDLGMLAVEDGDGTLVGDIGWFAVRHGPSNTARALNVWITPDPADGRLQRHPMRRFRRVRARMLKW